MIKFFNSIQQQSFNANRELCGFVGLDKDDNFITTKPTIGEIDSCLADDPPQDFEFFASYHTHGAFTEDAITEVPSSTDLAVDISELVDGYIATPGGRIWFNDNQKKLANLVCEKCVTIDSNYSGEYVLPIHKTYTVKQLIAREKDQ